MAFDPTGHDFLHAQRVAKLAQKKCIEDFKKMKLILVCMLWKQLAICMTP